MAATLNVPTRWAGCLRRVQPTIACHETATPSIATFPHAGADVHLGPLAHRTRGGPNRAEWPSRPLEHTEQLFGNEARPGGVEVTIALGILALDEETLGHDKMEIVLCPGHRDIEQTRSSSISAEVPTPRSEGMQPSTTLSI